MRGARSAQLPSPRGVGPAERDRPSARWRHRCRSLAIGGALLGALLLLSAASAPRAQAVDLNPIHAVGGLVGGAIGATIGKVAVAAFDAIIRHLFAPIAH